MSLWAKIVVAFVTAATFFGMMVATAGVFVVSAAGVGVARTVTTDAGRVARIGEKIADYNVPWRYGEEYAMDLLGFSVVGYGQGEYHGHIVLVQFPNWVAMDQNWMEWQCSQATESRREYGTPKELRVVGHRETVIRGEKVTLTVSEGVNHRNEAYRQVAGVFDGKQGPALLVIGALVEDWDEAEVNAFLASIA